LHFEDVVVTDISYQSRTKYYERLTSILKENYPDDRIFNHEKFDYYQSMKSKARFLRYTYQIMKDKIADAIKRAEALEQYHSNPVKPSHLHCPCTKVHHLVKELIA